MGAEQAHATLPRGPEGLRQGGWEGDQAGRIGGQGAQLCAWTGGDGGACSLLLGPEAILLPELRVDGGPAHSKGRDEDSGHPFS